MSYLHLVIVLLVVNILSEEITLPALARSRDEKPVVVESDIVAAQLVLAITVDLLAAGPLQ